MWKRGCTRPWASPSMKCAHSDIVLYRQVQKVCWHQLHHQVLSNVLHSSVSMAMMSLVMDFSDTPKIFCVNQVWWREFVPWEPHGRRKEPSPPSCPLRVHGGAQTSICIVCLCVCLCICHMVCMYKHTCVLAYYESRGQRTTLGVIPAVLTILYFDTGVLIGKRIHQLG